MLTQEQKATNFDTMFHIDNVRCMVDMIIIMLIARAKEHDQSKLMNPELDTFVEMTPKLAGSTYGSDEYKAFLAQMKPALDHHYANNRHHPEHHAKGVEDMTLVDLVEMLCDWKAATMRHNDGNIRKSIEINSKRFDIAPQLAKILDNTVKEMGW
jgi:hypothetical protein